ncbi:MAG: molybdopterin molybdenumtransferase MoeA, partial [Muriicola sp.]|nr:molybdopterin molybdenumtransferase MoeA [Muriicola sp.]
VELSSVDGCLWASSVENSGSGDLVYLTSISGFIVLKPRKNPYKKGSLVPFIATKRILGV